MSWTAKTAGGAHGRLVACLCVGVMLQVGLLYGSAQARGESALVEIVSQPNQVLGNFMMKTLDIILRSDSVEAVTLETSLWSHGTRIGKARTVSTRILQALPTTMSPSPGTVVAREGDRISMPSPHTSKLPPGVYAEQIDITVIDTDYDAPVDYTELRFFRVTGQGIEQISSTEYSDIIEPPFVLRDKTGHPLPARAGTGRIVPAKSERPAGFDILQDISSQGRRGDQSEADED